MLKTEMKDATWDFHQTYQSVVDFLNIIKHIAFTHQMSPSVLSPRSYDLSRASPGRRWRTKEAKSLSSSSNLTSVTLWWSDGVRCILGTAPLANPQTLPHSPSDLPPTCFAEMLLHSLVWGSAAFFAEGWKCLQEFSNPHRAPPPAWTHE